MRLWRMRTGISITVTPSDRLRLEALVRDRNAPQKQVWRAEIVLLSADGVGTNEIKRRTGNSKLHDVVGLYVNPTESLPGLKCQI